MFRILNAGTPGEDAEEGDGIAGRSGVQSLMVPGDRTPNCAKQPNRHRALVEDYCLAAGLVKVQFLVLKLDSAVCGQFTPLPSYIQAGRP